MKHRRPTFTDSPGSTKAAYGKGTVVELLESADEQELADTVRADD
jgi:hypothetical protein